MHAKRTVFAFSKQGGRRMLRLEVVRKVQLD
jgi:hypothetical protein